MKTNGSYPYLRGDGVPVASPLFQGEGGGAIPTSPLQFTFETIDIESAAQLCALWHSRMPQVDIGTCKMHPCISYAAIFDEGIYATAIWSQPIAANRLKDGKRLIELRRMAIGPLAPKNTASRMLSFMKRDIFDRFPNVLRLISYQDTGVHHGTIYKASGWSLVNSQDEFLQWDGPRSRPNKVQSESPKNRWELELRRVA